MSRLPEGVRVMVPVSALARAPYQAAPSRHRAIDTLCQRERGRQRGMTQYVIGGPHANLAPIKLGPDNRAGMVAFDGVQWLLTASQTSAQAAFLPAVIMSEGCMGLSPDVAVKLPTSHVLVVDPMTSVWANQMSASLSLGTYFSQCMLGVRSGLQGMLNAQRTLERHALVPSAQQVPLMALRAALGPAALKAAGTRYVQATQSRQLTWGQALFTGLSFMGWVRFLMRVDRVRQHESAYTSAWPQHVLASVYEESRSPLLGWVRSTYAGLRDKKWLVQPQILRPDTLLVGDTQGHGNATARGWLAAIGSTVLYVGRQENRTQRRVVQVHRASKQEFLVSVSAEKLTAKRNFAVLPGGLLADWGQGKPETHAWKFRLTDPAACEKLVRAVCDARVPLNTALATQDTPHQHLWRTPEAQAGHEIGLHFGLFPLTVWRQWLPRGFGMGLTRQKNQGHFVQHLEEMTPTGVVHAEHEVFTREVERLMGSEGVQGESVRAVVARGGGDNHTALTLSATFERSRATSDQVNRGIVEPLNQLFGTDLRPFAGRYQVSQREVTATLHLEERDLAQLDVSQLAAKGVPVGALKKVQNVFDAPTSPSVRAAAVGAFVQTCGVRGMAQVYKALQTRDAQLLVSTDSEAYARLHTVPETLEEQFCMPPHPDQGRRNLRRRFELVETALREVEQTRHVLQNDSLLAPASLKENLELCEQAEARLRALLEITGTHAPALCRQIRRDMRGGTWQGTTDAKVAAFYDGLVGPPRAAQQAHQLMRAAGALPPQVWGSEKARLRKALAARRQMLRADVLLPQARVTAQCADIAAAQRALQDDAQTGTQADVNAVLRRYLKRNRLARLRHFQQRRPLQNAAGKHIRRVNDMLTALQTTPTLHSLRHWQRLQQRARGALPREHRHPDYAAAQGLINTFPQQVASAQTRQQEFAGQVKRALIWENCLRLGSCDRTLDALRVRVGWYLKFQATCAAQKADEAELAHTIRKALRHLTAAEKESWRGQLKVKRSALDRAVAAFLS